MRVGLLSRSLAAAAGVGAMLPGSPVNQGGPTPDTSSMPVGPLCRSCGAALPPDIRWCATCYAPVTLYSRRERLHPEGGFVGVPAHTPRTSRWRAGPTSFGPLGRIVCTLALAALFPWWGLGGFNPLFLWALMGWVLAAVVVLRSTWKPERITDPTPTTIERFRARHPVLGRELRLSAGMGGVVLVVAVGGAAIAWLSLDDASRYV